MDEQRPASVVVVAHLAEQGVAVGAGGGGGRGAVLHVPQYAMAEVHCPQALHATLQIAVDGAAVGKGLVHEVLLVALLTLVRQDVQAAGGEEPDKIKRVRISQSQSRGHESCSHAAMQSCSHALVVE